jgi:PAS domain S-box-containing protein
MNIAGKRKSRKPRKRALDSLATGNSRYSALDIDVLQQEQNSSLLPVLRDLPVGIIMADASGGFTLFNREAERILGGGPEQIGSAHRSEVLGCYRPDRVTPFPSEELPLTRALRGEEVRDELILIRNPSQPDGVWIRVSAKPFANLPEEAGSAVVVLRDVTEQRRAIERIELLSRAVEQTADSVLITDVNGTIEYVNSAFEMTTGYTREEALGKTPAILKSGRQDAAFYAGMWSLILSGGSFRGSLFNRKKNGELYCAEQTITPIKNGEGQITHFVSLLKDVTEARKHQEQDIQMKLAREVQQKLYANAVTVAGLDIGAVSCPADETSGDYFDFSFSTDTRVDVAVGDVSGHGLDAALVMALTRAYVRAFSAQNLQVSDTLEAVNRMLLADLDGERYVTLLFARVNMENSTLSYGSAGHVPGFVLGRSGHVERIIESSGVPLGLFSACDVRTSTMPLKRGDLIVLLTDGVTEAVNDAGEELSIDRVIEYVQAHQHESAQRIADAVCDRAHALAREQPQRDDITAVILKVA